MSGTGITGLPIRRLTLADLTACTELARDRGWQPQETSWRLMYAVSEVYGVDDPAGGLAGTVVLTRYGAELAAIGMMLVATRHSRQGLGLRLMQHVLELAGGAVIVLFATDAGRPLYARLGFREAGTSTRHIGRFSGAAARDPAGAVRPAGPAELAGVAAIDRAVFGADRGRVLSELTVLADRFVECGEPVAGYGAVWPDGAVSIIGPVVADSRLMATALISALASDRQGPVRLDVASSQPWLAAWAVERGLRAGATNVVMTYGGSLPGDRDRLFAPASVAIG